MTVSERTRTVSAMGVVQIFTWGSTFYLLSVIAPEIVDETGWRPAAVTGGMSVGLLASGLAARRIGSLIQAKGGRPVMATGISLIAAGLVLMALSHHVALYLAAWLVTGLGMGASLYDAAFSALGRIYGREARGAITALTLWGGFASTVCWPISAWAVETIGWRGTCLFYAAVHVGFILPLCWFALPRVPPALAPPEPGAPAPRPPLSDPRVWAIAVTGTVMGMTAGIWLVHIVPLLGARGYDLAAAVALGTLIGPAQVAARVVEMAGRGRHHPIWTQLSATFLFAVGFAGLKFGMPAAPAIIAYGAGNGLWSIARGAVPLAVFGPRDYPRLMGLLATPMLLASAAAPAAGSVMIARLGAETSLSVLCGMAMIPLAITVPLWLRLRRDALDTSPVT